jgi:ABC-type polysaccharide/polyol phosphate transport system ATPase subunit
LLRPGAISVRGVSRRFKLVADRNMTLKETLLRRRRRSIREELVALEDINLEVRPGEAVGLIGQNGSGKSTLLKVIAGIIPPDEGTVEVGGQVASMLELGAGFHPDFSGRENVYMNAAIHGLSEREVDRRMDDIVAFAELPQFIDQPVRTYSSGMQMRLAFAVASHVNPDVLLLDEVLAVGDEAFQRKCMGRIFDYRRRGGTIIFVSHDPAAVELVCDRAVLLEHGRQVIDSRPEETLAVYRKHLSQSSDEDRRPPPEIEGPAPEAGGAPSEGAASYGTGRARVTGVRLLNELGDVTTSVLGGTALRIELDYLVNDEVADPKFTFRLNHVSGDVLLAVNSVSDHFASALPRPSGTVSLDFARLPLREGRFTLSVGISAQDETELYHLLAHWIEFSVFAPSFGEGILIAERRWDVAPVPTGADQTLTT